MMTTMHYIRQGDILFKKIDKIPSTTDYRILDTKTVALGEITGHSHSFTKNARNVLMYGVDEPWFVKTDGKAILTHQEHKAIQLPKGVYEIKKEQSYNPFLKQIQRSAD